MIRFTVTCACSQIVLHRLFEESDPEYTRLVGGHRPGSRITGQVLRQDVPVETVLDHITHGGFFVTHGPTDGLLFPDAETLPMASPGFQTSQDLVSRYLVLDCDCCGSRLQLASDALRQTMTLICPSCALPRQQYPFDAVRVSRTDTRLLLMTLAIAPPILQAHVARMELDAFSEDTLRRLASRGDDWMLSRDLGSTTSTPRTKTLARLELLRLIESRTRPGYGGTVFTQHQYRVTPMGANLASFYAWREQFAQERAKVSA